jgi:hypothetical protein
LHALGSKDALRRYDNERLDVPTQEDISFCEKMVAWKVGATVVATIHPWFA